MKAVKIDLSNRSVEHLELGDEAFTSFLGGRGLGVGLLAKVTPLKHPLDPSAPLIISVGALAGTSFPMSNRLTMVFRSPLTGTIAWTQTGGYAANELASLGFDALIITGFAERLSYLLLGGEGIKVVEAERLRGHGAVETCSFLKMVLGDVRVLAIGPAGEKQVKISTVVNDMGRTSGVRHGVGAVLGSKNLKAIVVKKATHEPKRPRDIIGFTRLVRRLYTKLKNSPLLNHEKGLLAVHGTAIAAEAFGEEEALPVKNYRLTVLENFSKIGGLELSSSALITRLTCSKCPVSCRRESVGYGVRGEGPDYAQISSLGTNCLVLDLEQIVYLTQLCYELGLDPIEMGNTLAVYAELSERGYIEQALKWGDFKTMCRLIDMTAFRNGVGDVLGNGAYETAEFFGDTSSAPSIKKISIQNTDPRVEHAWGLLNAVESFGGAAHVWVYPRLLKSFKRLGINTVYTNNPEPEDIAAKVYEHQVYVAALDSLGVCAFSNLAFNSLDYIEGLSYHHGSSLEADFLYNVGKNILATEKYLNELFGFSGDADGLPKRFLEEPVPGGKNAGLTCPLNELLRHYRQMRKDPDPSKPLSQLFYRY